MISLMSLSFLLIPMILVFLKNSLKIVLMSLLFSLLAFLILMSNLNFSFISLLFMLLFLGGILMMFMIISAILPNYYRKENFLLSWIFVALISYTIYVTYYLEDFSQMSMLKEILSSKLNIFILMAYMNIYFFAFNVMISTEKLSMRSMMI